MEARPRFTGDIQEDLEYLIQTYELVAAMLHARQETVAAETMQTVVAHLIQLKGKLLSKSRRELSKGRKEQQCL